MSLDYRWIVPIDVLYLRGNRLFGEGADHAEPLMPPWPSLFAGALRSRMLVDENVDLAAFAKGEVSHPVLGTPELPGPFRIAHLSLGRKHGKAIEPLLPLPSDVAVLKETEATNPTCEYLVPTKRTDLDPVVFPGDLPALPLLRVSKPAKPDDSGYWLQPRGFEKYLRGGTIESGDLVSTRELWQTDSRLGIALNENSRAAETGRIYTTEAVALRPDVGFVVGVAGASGRLPQDGLIRLGGDGRGATLEKAGVDPLWFRTPQTPGFRLILATPGLFPQGWLPPRVCRGQDGYTLRFRGLRARLHAAAIPRYQVISGWDLARWKPKPAQRVVPAGSVYWFEILERDDAALEEILREGLWSLMNDTLSAAHQQRRAEGFNNVWLGDWQPQQL
jgi:CRISPR-associated protein Cmr3